MKYKAHRSNILYYSKRYRRENWRKNKKSPLEQQKMRHTRHLPQLPIWNCGQAVLDKDTQLNSLKIKGNEIITDSNQGLTLFALSKHKSLGLLDIKTHKNKRMNIYFAVALPFLEWVFLGLLKDGREGCGKKDSSF